MDYLTPDSENLLNTRFKHMARNTIDYWMQPDNATLGENEIVERIRVAPVTSTSTLQLYLHIPFCAQKCSFCAFSGGNTLEFDQSERYIGNLVCQLEKILAITPIYGKERIRSIHIGGGSPDLAGPHIGTLLKFVRTLRGMDERTEIAVECAPSTTTPEFLDALIENKITKLSFGVQSINPDIRRAIRMPASLRKTEELCKYVHGQIPIVNADFITGLPGQTLADVHKDLIYALNHPTINAVSSYLLTPGAAPSLIADVKSGFAPAVPSHVVQSRMRLHTYTTLQKEGWVRRGTNTYIDRNSVSEELLNSIPGNECIGAAHYDAFLVAAGAQAIGSVPGVRFENIVNIHRWQEAVEAGGFGFSTTKSAVTDQQDMSLWTFPLFYQGLEKQRLDMMRASGAVSNEQIGTLHQLIEEGLVEENEDDYRLTVLGEVFMGHIVRLLKSAEGQKVLDGYISEGYAIADAISNGIVVRNNEANDRQTVLEKF